MFYYRRYSGIPSLEQVIGVRIPGGQPIHFAKIPRIVLAYVPGAANCAILNPSRNVARLRQLRIDRLSNPRVRNRRWDGRS